MAAWRALCFTGCAGSASRHRPGQSPPAESSTATCIIETCCGGTAGSRRWSTGKDAGPGDGAFDLVTLAFGLEPSGAAGAARRAAWAAALRSRPAPVLLAYSAHMALRQVDWSIRHHPDAVDRWLVISQSALDRIDRLAPARS